MAARAFLAFLLRALLVVALIAAAWWPELDTRAEAQVEAGLKRALLAFAMARGLNGVISVAQGTSVAIQPAGVGVVLAPGELLDPVNDLIEQFSTVMLFASASLGLQRLLIGMSGWQPLTIALSILAMLWLVISLAKLHRRDDGHVHTQADVSRMRMSTLVQGVLLVMLALRFAVPVSALLSETAYNTFLRAEYEQSQQALESAKDDIASAGDAVRPPEPEAEGVLDRAQRFFDEAGKTFDVEARLKALQESAAAITRNVIDLIAIFVVQTVILPLLFLWLTWLALTRGLPRLWAAMRIA